MGTWYLTDDAVGNMLKATILNELYGTLYGHNNLPVLCTMLKDIYAKKPQPASAATAAAATPGARAPFTFLIIPTKSNGKPQEEPFMEDKVNALMEAFLRMDLDGKPMKKPFKPFITQPRRRFKGRFERTWRMGRLIWQLPGKRQVWQI